MKKILIIFLLAVVWGSVKAQYQTVTVTGQTATVGTNKKLRFVWGANIFNISDSIAAANPVVNGFTITSLPSIGQTITTGTTQSVFQQLYQQSQPPIVSFSPNVTNELTSSATGSSNLTYVYSKQTGTNDFTSLQFTSSAGASSTIGATAGGGSGTYTAAYNANATTTFTFRANTTDKFAAASVTVSYLPRRGSGRSAGLVPTDAEILAAAGGSVVTPLSSSRAGTFTVSGSGSNYPFIYYVSSAGALTSLKDANNLEALSSYTPSTRTILNGNGPGGGASVTIRIYTAQNATAGNTTMVTQ